VKSGREEGMLPISFSSPVPPDIIWHAVWLLPAFTPSEEGMSGRLEPLSFGSLTGCLLVLESLMGWLLVAADMALNGGREASVIGSEAKDGCCIARALRAKVIVH
jgi:hypothetical protein